MARRVRAVPKTTTTREHIKKNIRKEKCIFSFFLFLLLLLLRPVDLSSNVRHMVDRRFVHLAVALLPECRRCTFERAGANIKYKLYRVGLFARTRPCAAAAASSLAAAELCIAAVATRARTGLFGGNRRPVVRGR